MPLVKKEVLLHGILGSDELHILVGNDNRVYWRAKCTERGITEEFCSIMVSFVKTLEALDTELACGLMGECGSLKVPDVELSEIKLGHFIEQLALIDGVGAIEENECVRNSSVSG